MEKKKSLKFESTNKNKKLGGSKKRLSIKLTNFEDKTRWRKFSRMMRIFSKFQILQQQISLQTKFPDTWLV